MKPKKKFSYSFKIIKDKASNPKVVVCKASLSSYSASFGSIYRMAIGKAICSDKDTFDEETGKKLALARAQKKILQDLSLEIDRQNDILRTRIESNKDMITDLLRMWTSVSTHEQNILDSFSNNSNNNSK